MTDDREERVRARAELLWERDGRPEGRHEEHWQRASAEIDAEASDPAGRSLGSAAQSGLLPPEAGQGSERPGSLVDTGPALGLVAGTAGTAAGLGNLSLGQEDDRGSGEPGGMSSIGTEEAGR